MFVFVLALVKLIGTGTWVMRGPGLEGLGAVVGGRDPAGAGVGAGAGVRTWAGVPGTICELRRTFPCCDDRRVMGWAGELTATVEARREGGGLIDARCEVIFVEGGGWGAGGLVSSRGFLKGVDASREGELTPVCSCGRVTLVAEEVGPCCERLGTCESTGGGEGEGEGDDDEDAESISIGAAASDPGIGSSSMGGSSSRGRLDSRRGTERSMVWITGRILFCGIEDGGWMGSEASSAAGVPARIFVIDWATNRGFG